MPNPRKPAGSFHPITTGGQHACIHSTLDRRFRLPEPLPPYAGRYDVHKFGPSCPQQRLVLPQGLNSQLQRDISNIVANLYEDVTPDDEDCEASFFEHC